MKAGKRSPNKKVLITRIIGSSVSVVASVVAIAGVAAAPFTAGTSLIPAYLAGVCTAVSCAGGMTSSVASLVQLILDRVDDNGLDTQTLENLVNILKERGLSPKECLEAVETLFKEVSCAAEKAAKESASLASGIAAAQGCKAAKAASNARKAASVSAVLKGMRHSPVVKLNGLSILFSTVDLVDASVRLHQLNEST